MGVALLKFSQGATVGGDGRALVVAIGATPVTIGNSTSGGGAAIGSYKIELLYAPPDRTTPAGYALVPGVDVPLVLAQANGDTPSASLDVSEAAIYGCYRIRETVWPLPNEAGTPDVDIRNVAVLTPNRALILPPYQKFPDPLPLTGVGSKPDEMNFENQGWGWSGPEYDAGTYPFRLVNEALKEIDTISGSILPVANYKGSVLYWNGSGWSYSNNDVATQTSAVPIYDVGTETTSLLPVSATVNYGATGGNGYAALLCGGTGVPAWTGIIPNHMTPAGSAGALYVINSDNKVVLASGPTPLDKYVPVWHTSLSPEIPQWKSILYAIPDGGPADPSIVYWGGSSWGITSLLSALPLVNAVDDGIVNDFPLTGDYLLASGAVGGSWVRISDTYIDDAELSVGKLAPGTEGYVIKVVGGVVTWAPDADGVTGTGVDNHIARWNGTDAIQNSTLWIDDDGVLHFDATGSSTTTPTGQLVENFASTNAARWGLSDNDGFMTEWGGALTLYSYNTLIFRGGRGAAFPTSFDANIAGIGHLFQMPSDARIALAVRASATPSVNLEEWQNSAGTALAAIHPSGHMLLRSQRQVRCYDDDNSAYIGLSAPSGMGATSYDHTLPTGYGTTGQVLTTNGAGVLSWGSLPSPGSGAGMFATCPAASCDLFVFQVENGYTNGGAIIPAGDITVTTLTVLCTQAQAGETVRGAIYDGSGNRLQTTPTADCSSTGLKTLTLSSSVALTAGTLYYVAITTDGYTNIRFAGHSSAAFNISPYFSFRNTTGYLPDPLNPTGTPNGVPWISLSA